MRPDVSLGPADERGKKLCECLARGMGNAESGRAAGYSEAWIKNHSSKYIRRYSAHIAQLKAQYVKEVARVLVIDQEMVLQEIARIAMYNDADYITADVVGDKPVLRFKRVDELSREQLAAVSVYEGPDKKLLWKARDKEGKLTELGKHLGMFNEKIILEHRHRHASNRMDLSNVPTDQLEALEGEFEELVAKHGGKRLIEAQ
jgi:phage terminase small subunit